MKSINYKMDSEEFEIDKDMTELAEYKPCIGCKHRLSLSNKTCRAFQSGIPDEIWLGFNDHTAPIEGQTNSIVFEPIEPNR
jgi:hypothetical protein